MHPLPGIRHTIRICITGTGIGFRGQDPPQKTVPRSEGFADRKCLTERLPHQSMTGIITADHSAPCRTGHPRGAGVVGNIPAGERQGRQRVGLGEHFLAIPETVSIRILKIGVRSNRDFSAVIYSIFIGIQLQWVSPINPFLIIG